MNPALKALIGDGAPDAAAIDAFIDRNRFPLVDRHGVTFVFRGEAESVLLRCFMSGLPGPQPLTRVADTDLWVVTVEFPEASRIEYKFEVSRDGHGEMILDPLNVVQARDPFGANSVCQGYGYTRPIWTLDDSTAREGKLRRHRFHSDAFGEQREILVYLPATFRRNRRYPLLICHDGADYVRYAALKTVLDNLITDLDIPPLVVALTQSPDRLVEYAGNDAHARFISEDLLGYMTASYPLIDERRSRAVMGASFGGVASLHASWSAPELFGKLLLQSGSFAFSDFGPHSRGEVFDPVVDFVNRFRASPRQCADRVYMSCGVYESLIYENRSLVPRLQADDMEVRFEEVRDAHNWENWRDRLRSALSWLFPGPNWVVYD
ncbi:MAG: alpha/beta hydrolase-fold protein [Pseudomonadota bacterium]